MKRLLLVLSLSLSSLGCLAQSASIEEEAIRQAEHDLFMAYFSKDIPTLERLIAPTFGSRPGLDKQAYLKTAQLVPGIMVDVSALKVRIMGDSAYLSGCLIMKAPTEAYYQIADWFVKSPMGWQATWIQAYIMPVWEGKPLSDDQLMPLTPVACSRESYLQSVDSDQPTLLKFNNTTTQPLTVHWINFDGERDGTQNRVRALAPGRQLIVNTYVTHPFVVTDAAGKCLGIYQPTTKPALAIIR